MKLKKVCIVVLWRGKSQATIEQEREHLRHKDRLDIKKRFDQIK